ncbi:YlzJ-like family protein [Marininema halotolerans]|uniref:YlzJ-like protein n=1 Tax=Marininema halotolerans TaxID=1155944 RepID=A0A1I6R617_9BACL|nr:YlzJ-like family protein [Marininema halotolerans]SFS59978.1 YlzJ-like protein [Marininema halotolerans]
MIYYSIVPPEVALVDASAPTPDYQEVEVEGILMTVEMVQGQARIHRLHSPDPAHYLDPRYQPGNVVNLV